MINLVRGDEQNLEGKLIVYSKIKGNDYFPGEEAPFIVSLYATADVDDFAKAFNIPKKMTDKLRDEGKKLEDSQSVELDAINKNSKDKKIILPAFYSGELIFYDEDTLFDYGRDVLYTGEFHNIHFCDMANHIGIDIYVANYAEQKRFGNKTVDEVFDKELAKISGLKSYINKHFVNPMIEYSANTPSNKKSFDRLKNEFLEFAAGKMYDEDVLELSDIIKNYNQFQDYTLISAYVDKIDALSREDFLIAAEMRDKIKKIKK